jgi:hypothetical protein
MSPILRFTLVEQADDNAKLALDGRLLDWSTPGRCLEAQYAHDDRFLLLLTADSPYEECLSVLLLDIAGTVLDTVELSYPYTPGLLSGFRVSGEASVDFSFFGGDQWRLTILEQPKRQFLHLLRSLVRYRPKWAPHWLNLQRIS